VVGGQSSALSAASVTTSYAAPAITSVSMAVGGGTVMGTVGGESVVIAGSNFGPVGASVGGYSAPNATYGVSGGTYSTTGCVVSVAHVELRCNSSGGVGTGHRWVVVVGGQSSALSAASVTTSYAVPAITGLVAVSGPGTLSSMPTSGGTRVRLMGTNLGPVSGNPVTARYLSGSLSFTGVGCVVVTPHVEVECSSNAGSGQGLAWRVTVGGQESVVSVGTSSYTPPSISVLSGNLTLDTGGGQVVYVEGSNLGPVGTGGVDVSGVYNGTGRQYVASGCVVVTAHVKLSCVSVAGVGMGHTWYVVVGGQQSAMSTGVNSTTSYLAPAVTGYPGVVSLSTAGSAGPMAWTGTGAAARRGGMPKWVWIVGLVVLSLLLWRVLAPSTTGDATAPAGPTSGASDAMPAPAPAPTR
jgi:hypothetical protein